MAFVGVVLAVLSTTLLSPVNDGIRTAVVLQDTVKPSARRVLACFEEITRLNEAKNCEDPPPVGISLLLLEWDEYEPAVVDSVLDGLAELALTSDHTAVKIAAALWLQEPGQTDPYPGPATPMPGIVDRVASVYWKSDEAVVRKVLIGRLHWQAERAEAVAFLEAAAQEDRPQDRGKEESPQSLAVATLTHMGPEGRATLERLHDQKSVVNPAARNVLEYLAGKGFKPN